MKPNTAKPNGGDHDIPPDPFALLKAPLVAAVFRAQARHYNRTDAGQGEFLAAKFQDIFRHDHKRKRDLIYIGHRWREDQSKELIQWAKEAARDRYLLATSIADSGERKKEAAWAIDSESGSKIEAALKMARTEFPIADQGNDWDNRPMLLPVANGVVDLETGKLRDGKQEDRLTLHTPIIYDPNAQCPNFEKFFAEILNKDADLVDFVHRAIGYTLTGLIVEQVLFILYGCGCNGKSVLLAVMRAVFGELAWNMPFSTVEMKNRAAIPNDVAALENRRLVTASETNENAQFNEARIKELTGGDSITARFLHHEYFEFDPVAKFWLSVNHKPRVADDSLGFWRRVRLIPFLCKFEGDNADPRLEAKLRGELPGILNFFIRGCLEYQRRALKPPDLVTNATNEYRRDSDPLSRFIEERCALGPGAVSASEIYKVYLQWAEKQGYREKEVLTANAFGRRLGDRFSKQHTKVGAFYEGITLCPVTN